MKYLFFFFIFIYCSYANEHIGFIKNIEGKIEIQRNNQLLLANISEKIYQKDVIITSSNSSAGIIFNDNTLISLGSNTKFVINEYLFEPSKKQQSFLSELIEGTLVCLTGLMSKLNPEAMKIKAKTATIGIRGTHFAIEVKK